MNERVVVTLAMVGTGYLVFQHVGVIERTRKYVAAVRAGKQPEGESAFTITPEAAKWLGAWLLLFALELAAVEAGGGIGTLAMLFSLVTLFSAAYRLYPVMKKEPA